MVSSTDRVARSAQPPGTGADDREAGPPERAERGPWPARLALGGIVLAALALRLWSLDHGLPFAYNPDERHFLPVAVGMFGGDYDPHYFENPAALTYLLHIVLRALHPLAGNAYRGAFNNDPTEAFLSGRVVVALLGGLGVVLVHQVGRRLYDRRVGLVAAALMATSFLPVFYAKQALNDVVTLVPVMLGLLACVAVWERGRPRDWLLAGAAIGAATATKYTAGAMLVTLALVAAFRLRSGADGRRALLLGLGRAVLAFAVVFVALNPFVLVDPGVFLRQVTNQAEQAGDIAKLGQDDMPGWLYYLWTLTWGLGWAPLLAAAAGAVLALRADRRRGLLLVAFPLVLLAFLGWQARWFARWLLPAYPALAVLAGYALIRLTDAVRIPHGWRWGRAAFAIALTGLLAVQGVVAGVHADRVLGRTDTRALARDWMVANIPAGSGLVVEPFNPAGWLNHGGRVVGPHRWERRRIDPPFQAYPARLQPGLIDSYRAGGWCWVVVGSYHRDRGLEAGLPGARAYYERLERESVRAVAFSPYRTGAASVAFNFDLSFNFLPAAYARPGPVVTIYQLDRCVPRPG